MTVDDAVRTLLAWGTPYAVPAPDAPLDDTTWRALVQVAERERLTALLCAAVDADWPATPAQRDEIVQARRELAMWSLRLDGALARVAGVLDAAGIDWRLLKGAATAHVAYADATWRQSGDLDLWVRRADFDRAWAALAALPGHREDAGWLGPQSDALRKDRAWALDDRVEVDLHRWIEGLVPQQRLPDAWFERTQPLELAGRTVHALAPGPMYVHAALHLASAGTRLSSLADLIRLHEERLDLGPLVADLTPLTAATVIHGIAQARAAVPGLPVVSWERVLAARAGRVAPRVAGYLRVHPVLRPLGVLAAAPGWRARGRFVAEALHPSDAYLAQQGRSRREHRRLATRAVVGGLRPGSKPH